MDPAETKSLIADARIAEAFAGAAEGDQLASRWLLVLVDVPIGPVSPHARRDGDLRHDGLSCLASLELPVLALGRRRFILTAPDHRVLHRPSRRSKARRTRVRTK